MPNDLDTSQILDPQPNSVFQRLTKPQVLHVDDPEGCLPLYLRHDDPMCVPILSHNSPTNNILLKITVPKRTGKRKRGSQDPYSDTVQLDGVDGSIQNASLSSAHLLRTLRDNAGQYEVEAVAEIDRTHRFRGTNALGSTCEFILMITPQVSRIFIIPQSTAISHRSFRSSFFPVKVCPYPLPALPQNLLMYSS